MDDWDLDRLLEDRDEDLAVDLITPDASHTGVDDFLAPDHVSFEETVDSSVDTSFALDVPVFDEHTPVSDFDPDQVVWDPGHCGEYDHRVDNPCCVWWSPYGPNDARVLIQAPRPTLELLHNALNERRLYISPSLVRSPYEALTASFWYWQKQGVLPSPADLAMFESMPPDDRYPHGVGLLRNSAIQGCEPYLRDIVAILQRLELYSLYMTGVSTFFQLGLIREEVRDGLSTCRASLVAARQQSITTTIWIHQRLVHEEYGNVRSEWSALTDGTMPPPVPVPATPQAAVYEPVTPDQQQRQVYTDKGKKRARSPSPPPAPRKRLQPTQLYPATVPAYTPSPAPLPSGPCTNNQLRSRYFPLPYPAEATRRARILAGSVPPGLLLNPAVCPKEDILPSAKLLTNTVIILLAKHFSNTEIFDRINAILQEPDSSSSRRPSDGRTSSHRNNRTLQPDESFSGEGREDENIWRPLRDANVITRRITVAVESEARRRGVHGLDIRREIQAGRAMNGVVTGRGKGVRRPKREATVGRTGEGREEMQSEGNVTFDKQSLLQGEHVEEEQGVEEAEEDVFRLEEGEMGFEHLPGAQLILDSMRVGESGGNDGMAEETLVPAPDVPLATAPNVLASGPEYGDPNFMPHFFCLEDSTPLQRE